MSVSAVPSAATGIIQDSNGNNRGHESWSPHNNKPRAADAPGPAPIGVSNPSRAALPSPLPSPRTPHAPPRRPTKHRDYGHMDQTMNGPLYMQTSNRAMVFRRHKRKNEGPAKQLARWFVENQLGFAVNLLALLALTHACMPKLRGYTTKFFTLSYHDAETGQYGVGRDDAYFVTFLVVFITGLRAALIEHALGPLAKANGVRGRRDVAKFCEQAFFIIYFATVWSIGVYLYYKSPAWLSLEGLWTHFPSREITSLTKVYIMTEFAYYLQQLVIINVEDRRKDHWQMFTHHVITSALIYSSYRYGFTPVAVLILVLMDLSDIFLGIAKCSKYMHMETFCDYMFGGFMLSWAIPRHVLFPVVLYSVWKHSYAINRDVCYRGSWNKVTGPYPSPPADEGKLYWLQPLHNDKLICYDHSIMWGFLSMLMFLEVILAVWFAMIVRVAIKVVRGHGAEDVRSDSEGDEADNLDAEDKDEDGRNARIVYEEVAGAIEEEVGVEELDLRSWERRAGVKRQASASTGVNLPGHSDRKELLGRIGCEKQME